VEVTHIDAQSPTTLGGFRGMGEGGTIGAPAAPRPMRWRHSASR
jgi:carbon-monoxide dehydrogenase large subunit